MTNISENITKTVVVDDDHDDGLVDEPTELFQKASRHLSQIMNKASDENLLYLYARYKQAVEGPCNTNRPGMFEFQAKKKWDAWNSIKELSKEDAKAEYVDKIKEIDPAWTENTLATPKCGWNSVSCMVSEEEEIIPDDKKTAFDWCKEGNLDGVKKCLSQPNTDVDDPDEIGLTLLHWSCDRGHINITKYVIDCNADINITDSEGQTPLHYACACAHQDIVKLLLESGADLKMTDSQGETALQVCEDEEVKKMVSTWVFWRGSGESI